MVRKCSGPSIAARTEPLPTQQHAPIPRSACCRCACRRQTQEVVATALQSACDMQASRSRRASDVTWQQSLVEQMPYQEGAHAAGATTCDDKTRSTTYPLANGAQ